MNCKNCNKKIKDRPHWALHCSNDCKNEYAYKLRKERKDKNQYLVYYIPSKHYCGCTKQDISRRMSSHKKDGVDVEGWRVLYSSPDKKDAYYHEALFQSVLGINGLNFK